MTWNLSATEWFALGMLWGIALTVIMQLLSNRMEHDELEDDYLDELERRQRR